MDYINNTDSLNIHFILWIQSIQILKENFRSKVTQYYANSHHLLFIDVRLLAFYFKDDKNSNQRLYG